MNRLEFFENTPIFAMLHLAGEEPVRQALDELTIFEEEGVDGVIVENYHGSEEDVVNTLLNIKERRTSLHVGVNILPNNYQKALHLADAFAYPFIQLDYVAGRYLGNTKEISLEQYLSCRENRKDVLVLGGVWPKYYTPVEGSDLESDLREGMERADAIVVTGEGTGMQTPSDRILKFREVIGGHPLVIGAGLTPRNAYGQLMIADGGIVGSCFKVDEETSNLVDRGRVRAFMDVVLEVRKEKKGL